MGAWGNQPPLGGLTPAHAGNAYEEDYVFAEPTTGDDVVNRRGWVPHHLLEFVEVEVHACPLRATLASCTNKGQPAFVILS